MSFLCYFLRLNVAHLFFQKNTIIYSKVLVHDKDAVCRLLPFKNLIVPGNDIIHIVDININDDNKSRIKSYDCFKIKWFDLKNDSVTKIEAGDHSLNSYNSAIKGVQNKIR